MRGRSNITPMTRTERIRPHGQLRHMAEEVIVIVELNRDCARLIVSSRALAVGLDGAPVRFFG